MGLEGALREAGDAGEDLVRALHPDVGLAGLIVNLDELLNRRDSCSQSVGCGM